MRHLIQWWYDLRQKKRSARTLNRIRKTGVLIGGNISIYDNVKIQRRYGGNIKIGNDCELMDGVLILTYGGDISIGDRCSINPYTIIYGHGGVRIGNDVLIAGGCMIIPNNHKFERTDITIREQGCTSKGINIEDDVWIGHGCTILDGVTIGKGAIIGAGSVVNRDVGPYTIHAGTPARLIKSRME